MGWFGRSNAKVVDEGAVSVSVSVSVDEGDQKQNLSNSKGSSKDNNTDTDRLDDDTGTPVMEDVEDDDLNAKVQDVMSENVDVMRDIVFRIRDDPDFAKSIYANCPRLQELLKKNPDLRPIFENPKLVRINFEKVYRDQGGVLPEDEDEKEPGIVKRAYEGVCAKIAIITSHPLFKVFKVLMIIKKAVGFLSPTKGFGVIKGFLTGLFEDPDAEPTDVDGDADADADADEEGNPDNLETKMQLNAAAEHMEDPEVQERMEEMLENPDSMEETIESDPQLKALRDENPLCAELMANPDTMRILVDPDNLRALGEAPDLIEQDFLNPDSFVPEEIPDVDVDAPDVDAGVDAEVEETANDEVAAEEEDSNMYDDMADGKEDVEKKASAKGGKNKRNEKKEGDKDEAKSWMQAAANVVGGQAIASLGLGDMLGGAGLGFGGAPEMEAPEIEAPEIEAPEIEAPEIEAPEDIGMEAELLTEDLPAEGTGDLLEEVGAEPEAELAAPEIPVEDEGGLEVQGMEADVEVGKKQDTKTKGANSGANDGPEVEEDKGYFGAAMGAGASIFAATTLGSMLSSDQMGMVSDVHENYVDRKDEAAEEEEEGEDGENEPKSRFAILGAVQDFAKDTLISSALGGVVGDDLAGNILDTQEEIEEVAEEEDEEEEGESD